MAKSPAKTKLTGRRNQNSSPPVSAAPSGSNGRRPPTLTPYVLKNEEVERALLVGSDTELLEDYFGKDQLATLQRLARDANTGSMRGGPRVLILPGIMGSTLGFPRNLIWDDVIWVDPLDVALGNLRLLKLNGEERREIQPLGVILFAYLALKLRLRSNGFDADFYPFDWRRDIRDLGKDLVKQLQAEGKPVHLVAHSMGGLVARAVATLNPPNLRRIVTLGTPNFGSFSPIQAFRGVHSIVRKLARLDVSATQDELGEIFKTFPGLCNMFPGSGSGTDYFTLESWPGSGILPSAEILAKCKKVLSDLPNDYEDLVQIIGCNRETVVSASIENDEFVYTTSLEGDGTVPISFATLPGRTTYFIPEDHGNLPNNSTLAKAVTEILNTGNTSQLPQQRPATRNDVRNIIPEHTLRSEPIASVLDDNRRVRRAAGTREGRDLLKEFASSPVPQIDPAAVPGAAAAPLGGNSDAPPALCDRIVIGRRHQFRLDVTLALGSITDIDASAYVLGLFSQVTPGGAAKVINDLMNGAVMQLSERRMLNGKVGAVSFLPKGRHPLRADLITFVGLGAFDGFKEETLEAVAENLIRTLLLSQVDDFAMVPFGGGTGVDPAKALRHMMSGFTRGLVDADGDQRFRGVTICELDPDRYREIQRSLYNLCGTSLFDNVEVTLREKRLALPRRMTAEARPVNQPIYLLVRQEDGEKDDTALFVSSLLTVGDRATTFQSPQKVRLSELHEHLDKIQPKVDSSVPDIPAFGKKLAELLLSEDMRKVLADFPSQHLIVVHDAAPSRVPWETLYIGANAPALSGGLSHRYEAKDLSTAKWLQTRKLSHILNMLLVVNPTKDLPGAEKEGDRIAKLIGNLGAAARVKVIPRDMATRETLLDAFSSGQYDVIHYAGHAFFDKEHPERSGILCAGRQVLAGSDLASLANLPSLMFFNACEAARIRRDAPSDEPPPSMPERLARGAGFAEALLRGGVANYVGTYWPVGDDAALKFAEQFYQSLLASATLGEAMLKGRQLLKANSLSDWADYILYGDPNFVLKPENVGDA